MGNVTAKTSGDIASFMTPAETNIKSLKVHFSPKQLGEGDPSPDNVREIVGWDGVEVNGCGKNLINPNTVKRGYRVNIQGEVVLAATYCLTDYIPVFPSSKYYLLNAGTLAANARTAFYDKNKELLSTTSNITPITTPNNCAYIRCSFKIENIDIVQLELGSAATLYKPYQGNTISYQWKLPDEYQEVEYIENSGNSYLKIPYAIQRYDEIETKLYTEKSGVTFQTPFSIGAVTYQTIIVFAYDDDIYVKYFTTGNAPKITLKNTKGIPLLFTINSNGLLTCKNENNEILGTIQSSYQQDIDGEDTDLYLFIRANKKDSFYGRNYGFKITNNNNLCLNLIPCYRKSNNEIGMYDTVSQTFYTNQGTGEFLKGDDVNKTFYGGYVDLISGELKNTYGIYTFEENGDYEYRAGSVTYVIPTVLDMKIGDFYTDQYVVCDRAKKVLNRTTTVNNELQIKIGNNNNRAYLYNTVGTIGIDNETDFRQWIKDNPISFTYPLLEPVVYQLTPTQLSSFIGQNNFWSNADYVEIEYELKETEDIQKARKKIILNQPHIESISDKIVSFNTDMVAPLKNCKIYFNPIQLGTGDPSPTNVRNINGWTSIDSYANGNKVSVDWTNDIGTVYGGYVDLAKGELVAEWELAQGKWGDIKSSTPNSTTGFYQGVLYYNNTIIVCHHQKDYYINTVCNIINTILWKTAEGTPEHYYGGNHTTNKGVMYIYGNFDDDLIVQIAARLAEPIHYQLTPQQILTFKSTNHIWSETNGQQIDVTYWTRKNLTPTPLTNYFENQTWVDSAYIGSSGKKTTGGTSASHFLTNQILLEVGTYVLSGFSYYVGTDNTNFRIHAYDSTGKWLRQITFQQIGNLSPVDISFTLDTDTYVNVSIAMDFDGVLAKIN